MKTVLYLLRPRLWSIRNRIRLQVRWMRWLLFGVAGLAFWAGIFVLTHRVLAYFQKVEDIGDLLAYKLLAMVLLTFFLLLMFSSILTTLSKLYLSRDLNLVHSMPVNPRTLFLSRWIESTVDSSWMVLVYAVPVLISYGRVFHGGPYYYAHMVLTLTPLCIIASALSALLVMLVVVVLPASRIRSIVVFLGLALLILLYVAFRLLRPERLVDPEAFGTVMIYLQSLSAPASPLLPSTWALDSLKAALGGEIAGALFHVGLAWSAALFFSVVVYVTAGHIYFRGFSKAQTAMVRLLPKTGWLLERLFSVFPGPTRAFLIKETRSFWRDQTQWSQLFLIAALIGIYIYNFSVLPLEKSPIKTIYLQNLLSFMNMGLAAFVLTAVSSRFAFPSVSVEGPAFWIVRSAPIALKTFLWIKFMIYVVPLLLLSEILIVASNMLLHVTPLMMWLSIATLFLMTPAVVALGIGLGAAYPDFNAENPVQTVTSFGGVMFMLFSAAYIVCVTVLEAGPVYTLFMAGVRGVPLSSWQWVWVGLSFGGVVLLSLLAVLWPMRYGARQLRRLVCESA